jgi:hypothetical protein
MRRMNIDRARRWIAGVLAVILGAGVVVVISDDTGPDGTHHRAVTVSAPRVLATTVDSEDAGRAPDERVTAPAPVVAGRRRARPRRI